MSTHVTVAGDAPSSCWISGSAGATIVWSSAYASAASASTASVIA